MKEEEDAYVWRDGAGNSGLRNDFSVVLESRKRKAITSERLMCGEGYLPENESESAFPVDLLCPSGSRVESLRERTMIRAET